LTFLISYRDFCHLCTRLVPLSPPDGFLHDFFFFQRFAPRVPPPFFFWGALIILSFEIFPSDAGCLPSVNSSAAPDSPLDPVSGDLIFFFFGLIDSSFQVTKVTAPFFSPFHRSTTPPFLDRHGVTCPFFSGPRYSFLLDPESRVLPPLMK